MWMILATGSYRQTHSPSRLAWSEGWWPPSTQSAFIKWTGWTLTMALRHDDSTINIVVELLLLLSWEKDTLNTKPQGRQWETTPAKIFLSHDMMEGCVKNLLHSRIVEWVGDSRFSWQFDVGLDDWWTCSTSALVSTMMGDHLGICRLGI